jgi:hypothetical protein
VGLDSARPWSARGVHVFRLAKNFKRPAGGGYSSIEGPDSLRNVHEHSDD